MLRATLLAQAMRRDASLHGIFLPMLHASRQDYPAYRETLRVVVKDTIQRRIYCIQSGERWHSFPREAGIFLKLHANLLVLRVYRSKRALGQVLCILSSGTCPAH